MQEYPAKLAADSLINFEHSKADFPVVITSSTTNTLESLGIVKPLLKINLPSDLSAKIVSKFNCLPISYPTTIPPIAGDKTISIDLKFFLMSQNSNLDIKGQIHARSS